MGVASAAERIVGALGKYKSGAHGLGGLGPGNFEILHALKCMCSGGF